MIEMKLHLVGLALRQPAGAHPSRDRNCQLADVMGIGCPSDIANVGCGKTHLPGRCSGKRCDCARMAERKWHPHVDHGGDCQISLLASLVVEHRMRLWLQR